MTYDQGNIVIVPFPFTDSKTTKRRPALVISCPEHQAQTGHASMLMITTAKHTRWHDDWMIQNLAVTNLTAPSIIRQKIFTIDLRLVIKKVGLLASEDHWQIAKRLHEHFKGLLIENHYKYTINEPKATYTK